MNLLLHTMATPDLSPIGALDLAEELNLDGIDLICQGNFLSAMKPNAKLQEATILRKEADLRGLRIGAFTPYEKHFNAANQEIRTTTINQMKHAVLLAEELGASSVRVLAGEEVDEEEWEEALKRLVDSLKIVADFATEHGVTLNIENHDGTMAVSASKTMEIWSQVNHPKVGIIYDPANLIRDQQEGFPENLDIQAKAIQLIHVKDYIFFENIPQSASNPSSRKCMPVGDGMIPWSDILKALHKNNHRGDLTFEYEMRWYPEQLPPTPIGIARSRDFILGVLKSLPIE